MPPSPPPQSGLVPPATHAGASTSNNPYLHRQVRHQRRVILLPANTIVTDPATASPELGNRVVQADTCARPIRVQGWSRRRVRALTSHERRRWPRTIRWCSGCCRGDPAIRWQVLRDLVNASQTEVATE